MKLQTNSAIRNTLKEAEKRIDELSNSDFIENSKSDIIKETKQILRDCFGVEK